MKKLWSIIKVTMSQNMDLFRINTKKKSRTSRITLFVVLCALFFFSMFSYSYTIMEKIEPLKMEHLILSLFVGIASILTIVEGIYKSGELLFNAKDDSILFPLPIKRSSVLILRVFKFYIFELMYNTLFLAPAMVVYAMKVNVGVSYYLVSFLALFLIPIIPIVISCIIGSITSFISAKSNHKNIVQIIVTTLFVLVILYFSVNMNGIFDDIASNGNKINNAIVSVYYPAKAYVSLVMNFNILDLLLFILVNLLAFFAMILLFGKIYFKINSNMKVVKKVKAKDNYVFKVKKPMKALIQKEIKKFFSIPVFVINAGFGLVLFILVSILFSINYNGAIDSIKAMEIPLSSEQIMGYIPIVIYIIVCAATFMTSITSSMISLEKNAFSLLKALPVTPLKIVTSKVLAAVIIMLPCLFIGEIILFVRFKLSIIQMLIIIAATVIISLLNEMIGIIINLKFPKLDAKNDTEIVKQSISSAISVFIGMALAALTVGGIVTCIINGISQDLSMLIITTIYLSLLLLLTMYVSKKGTKLFNDIEG